MPMPVSAMVMTLACVVHRDADRQFGVCVKHIVVGQQLELDAVERIGCIGNQLAQKDFAIGVE